MQTSTMLLIVAVILVVVGAGWYFYATPNTATAPTQTQMQGAPADSIPNTGVPNTGTQPAAGVSATVGAGVGEAPMHATVTYNGTTFTPAVVTIPQGGSVTFTDTAGSMWVAADAHPTHTQYDGTSRTEHCAAGYTGAPAFDQCKGGSSYSFTFTKAGSFHYHDHLKSSAEGVVVVQ